MNSSERLKAALRCEEVDYVPCAPWFFGNQFPGRGKFSDERERCETFREFGLDGYFFCSINTGKTDSVTSKVWQSDNGDITHKVFHTPAGDLAAAIRPTEDTLSKGWVRRDDIALFSDSNPSHYVKPWIQNLADVECFKHVYCPPGDTQIKQLRSNINAIKPLADEYGFPLIASIGYGLTYLIDLMGGEEAVMASIDTPELIDEFMDLEHEVNLKMIEIMLGEGVEIILRDGFYETTDFWNPKQVEEIVLSRINREADAVHAGDGILIYTVCTGIRPLLDMYRESKIDGFIKYETKLTEQYLPPIAEKLKGVKSLWGGISDCEDLGRGTAEQVRQAVRELFENVGRKGLIVAASPSIKPERPADNVIAMFDEWKKLR